MSTTAKKLMHDIICIPGDKTVAEACALMKRSNIGSVFVGDKDAPEGIFTERDVTRRVVAEGMDPRSTTVGSVMTKKLVTVESSAPLEKVFGCLAQGQFRHLPITERGKIVGIVSLTDLAKVFREMVADESFLEEFSDKVKR